MIATLFAAILFAAPSDSSPSPFGIDFETGYQACGGRNLSGWYQIGSRLEWRELLLVDVAWSRPSGYKDPNLGMAWGKQPESSRYGMRFCMGVRSHGAPAWFAAGAGWAFARLDTLETSADSRMILVEDASGTHVKTGPSGSIYGGAVPVYQSWVWNNRVYRSAPYAMAEAGIGREWFALGVRSEYRLGWGIGGFVQIRFRSSGGDR